MASEQNTKNANSRRDFLFGVAGLAAVAGGWQLWLARPRSFEFTRIGGLPEWRMLQFNGVSAPGGNTSSAVFAGIDDGSEPVSPLPVSRLCDALFERRSGNLPVAVFSDFFCPYCRVLTMRIAKLVSQAGSRIDVTWHELPLLGPASVTAARAAIAADMQDGYADFAATLMQSPFRPSPQFLSQVAERTGLNPGQLLIDMEGQTVSNRLDTSLAASKTLGIWGTPAIVVGRTVVMGQINDAELDRLIELELRTKISC